MARDAAQYGVERLAGFDRGKIGERHFCALRQFLVGNFQTALRLVDNIVEIVLEWDAGHAGNKPCWFAPGKSDTARPGGFSSRISIL